MVFSDEAAVQTTPNVCRTWAPIGQTPILIHSARREKASMIGGLTWHPATGHCDILAHFYPGANINAERAIVFLDGLHQMIKGEVILIWDNLRVHHSEPVKEYILANAAWLQVVNLPSYSPDLNPIEFLWSAWKRTHFANVCRATASSICDILFENEAAASDQSLLRGCLLASGLIDKEDMKP